jgi:hypothetical protein
VPNSKLSLVTTPRGMCKPEELKGFNLSLSKVDVPTTEPDPSALKPDPSINTTEPENNQPGVACPADVLTHRESRWFDLPVDGEGVVPGAMLKLCNDGVVKIEKVRCNPGYAPRNNACVRASPGGTQPPPPPPPPSDCDAAGLLDGETQDSDMPAEPTGVPGKWLKKCESGAIKVVGIVCHAGWTKQGNACVADGRPPLEETNECKTFGLGEGDTRFEDMPQVDGEVRGRFQITCVNGALERDFFCLKPWYRAGDRCEGGEQPDDSLPPLPDSDPSTNPDVTPGGDVEPTGGVPGNGGLTISFGGSLIGGISQLVTDLLNILFQSGSLPPLPGQLIFQAGCLKQGGSCLTTPSGGTITLGPLGTLVDSITQQDIKAGGNPLVLSNNGKMLIDLLTGQAVVSGPFTIGGQPILTTGGSGSIFNLIGNALNTGTPLGTPPASPAAPVNIDGTSERPKFTNVNWLKALNAPGTGTPRPDSVNIPNGLGNGGSSLRDCVVNGIVYGNGREWTQNAQGGMVVRYRCDDGTVRELSRACSDGYTNEGGQCRRGCRVGDRFYRHGQRWDQVSASSVQYLTCENGSVRVYDSGCVSGYSQDAQGQCQRDCAPGYPSGSSGVFDIANGKGNYTCDRGNWLFSSVASCNAGYTQSGNACVVLTRDCAWPQGGSLGHGQRRRVDINGGYVEFSCNNGQLTSDGAACYQGYQSGQSTPRFPYYTCAEIPPKRNCSYTYRYMHEDMVLTLNHGTIGTYLFQNGRIQAYCDDGTLRARGLPVCDPGFVFPGGVLGALGSIVLGNSNMQCTPGPR